MVCSYGGAGIWGVNRAQNIYTWKGRRWHHIRGKLTHIAVGGTQVWGVNRHHHIYRYLGGHRWQRISGGLTNVSYNPAPCGAPANPSSLCSLR